MVTLPAVFVVAAVLIAVPSATSVLVPTETQGCVKDEARPWNGVACPGLKCDLDKCGAGADLDYNEAMENGATEKPGFGDYEYVVVIGVDGMGGYWLEDDRLLGNVTLPNLDWLRAHGSWTYHARQVMPTVSKPNWASIVMGAGPEETGILDNDWVVGTQMEPLTGNNTYFPTMFEVAHEQSEGKIKTAFYNDWAGFDDVFPRHLFDEFLLTDDPDAIHVTERLVADVILPKKANLMMVHYDDVDEAGHGHGWGTFDYYKAVETADASIGNILHALHIAGIEDKTLVIVTADHGGQDHTHGYTDEKCMYTPLILYGPGIKQGNHMPCPTKTQPCYEKGGKNIRAMDVAPTVLHALGLLQPDLWIGRTVTEAFEHDKQ